MGARRVPTRVTVPYGGAEALNFGGAPYGIEGPNLRKIPKEARVP